MCIVWGEMIEILGVRLIYDICNSIEWRCFILILWGVLDFVSKIEVKGVDVSIRRVER